MSKWHVRTSRSNITGAASRGIPVPPLIDLGEWRRWKTKAKTSVVPNRAKMPSTWLMCAFVTLNLEVKKLGPSTPLSMGSGQLDCDVSCRWPYGLHRPACTHLRDTFKRPCFLGFYEWCGRRLGAESSIFSTVATEMVPNWSNLVRCQTARNAASTGLSLPTRLTHEGCRFRRNSA